MDNTLKDRVRSTQTLLSLNNAALSGLATRAGQVDWPDRRPIVPRRGGDAYLEGAGRGRRRIHCRPIGAWDASVRNGMLLFDATVVGQIANIISTHFRNGYKLSSTIEMARFRDFAAKDFGTEIALSDDELKGYLEVCGTLFDGKVYVVSNETKDSIKEQVEEYFASGARVIFYTEFYAKNRSRLSEASVVQEEILISVLRNLFPKQLFTQTYFGHTNDSIPAVIKREVLRVWGGNVLQTCEQLANILPYIPRDRITKTLEQNNDFIWDSVEKFTHIGKIDITDEERLEIINAAEQSCNALGYASVIDLPLKEFKERNHELSIPAVTRAVYRVYLSDRFDKADSSCKIITLIGHSVDVLDIMMKHFKTIDSCSHDELLKIGRELTMAADQKIMAAGNAVLVRVDEDRYVAGKYVDFNADVINKADDAIEKLVEGDYLPLKSFTIFVIFPSCGQKWNPFLLESYCRRFSKKFRFDAPAFNSKNAGAVIRQNCTMDYTEIMADAAAKSGIILSENDISNFLVDNGYTGKRIKVDEIINIAKAIREKGV
jgi:hypothetical protein